MLRDQTNKAIQALNNVSCATEYWDDWLIFLVTQKFDKSSRKAWELKLGDTRIIANLINFSYSRVRRACNGEVTDFQEENSRFTYRVFRSILVPSAKRTIYCINSTFLKQIPSQRFEFIKNQKRYVNCLSTKHVKDCTNSRTSTV